jgi:hypothetical protein
LVQGMLQGIGGPGKTWNDMLEILNRQYMDRAVTARELWANHPEYDVWVAGIAEYR